MSATPPVSIGVPVYNGERFLALALDGLLAQTYPDFELIISDNGSTDGTAEICRDYAARDRRIRYHRAAENRGLAWNYRRVFELSNGRYFKWAAADDVCAPEFVDRCLGALEGDPTGVLAYSKTRFLDAGGRLIDTTDKGWDLRSPQAHERLRYVIRAGHWVNSIFGLIRADALARTRLVASYPGGDYRLLGELAVIGKFFEVPDHLFFRRLHPGASSQHTDDLGWQVHFYTGHQSRFAAPTWRLAADHFRTIARARLSLRHKLSLVITLLRRLRWEQDALVTELRLLCSRPPRRHPHLT